MPIEMIVMSGVNAATFTPLTRAHIAAQRSGSIT